MEGLNKQESLKPEVDNDTLVDMLFYKPDNMSYNGVLLATCVELSFLIVMLNNMEKNYLIGIFILVNIVFLLMLFSSALQMKVYHKNSAITVGVFGVYSLSRLFTVPFVLNVKTNLVLFSMMTIAISVLSILSCVNSLTKIKKREQFKKDGKIKSIQMSK